MTPCFSAPALSPAALAILEKQPRAHHAPAGIGNTHQTSHTNIMRHTLTILLLAGACSVHAASIYYVDGINGNDNNSGLGGAPVKTIRKGLTKVHAGDTLKIAGSQTYL